MSKHLIVGRFGPTDQQEIPSLAAEVETTLDLLEGDRRLGHGIGIALDELLGLNVFPTEVGLDLMVLAALVQAADTRAARKSEAQDGWSREFRLMVPVSDTECWDAAKPVLKRMLDFLTGDRWFIEFRTRPDPYQQLIPAGVGRTIDHSFNALSLFSGGLDSLIGAIDLLHEDRCPLLISHAGERATSDAQASLLVGLMSHYRQVSFRRLRVWMNFRKSQIHIPNVRAESTTRGRSFLFFAIGAFAGSGFGDPVTLLAPENGLIALNVPLDNLRLGALSTRTTHPFYMARWNELLNTIGLQVQVENPYWYQTKGEMVRNCHNVDLLNDLVTSSLSCSSPTKERWRGVGTQHCGYCLPCLIRRAAMDAGLGQGVDQTPYTVDVRTETLNTCRARGQQVRSFQYAFQRIQASPDTARMLIHKPGPLSDYPERWVELEDVYRRGLDEVAALLTGVTAGPI